MPPVQRPAEPTSAVPSSAVPPAVDVHQHLWPEPLLDRLRARSRPPYLRGWTLHTAAEAPYDVRAADHDVASRVAADRAAGTGLACVSLSAPLGVESLPRPEADELLAAWHDGAAALPGHFAAWASVADVDPDLEDLAARLAPRAGGFVGVQLPATSLGTPQGWDRLDDVLAVAAAADRPVLVHPGPVAASPADAPGWWAPVVDYTAQLHAAWWAWHAAAVRARHPGLRVVLVAAAGLAPLHHERHAARGGDPAPVDPDLFVDTSSYGPRALDAVVRALGVDTLVLGSDRPYAEPLAHLLGDAATHAVRVVNPRRLLGPRGPAPAAGAAPDPDPDPDPRHHRPQEGPS
ncbi:amidohydrolase [Nocardioides sp. Leaf285]|uniref:amidohydrolase n=1 Tax=Nocardioides sp. Leaf285 TaxID=1736322 RepID=UPI000AC791AF|nr:amidohydrolase [Nocardioides sp. Leaf285]